MSFLDRIVQKVVSHPRGREIRRLKEQRAETIKMCGGTPVKNAMVMETVVDLGMQEAEHKEIEPDLLLMSTEQYESLGRNYIHGNTFELTGWQTLYIVHYDWLDGLYLIESKDL